MARSRSRGRKSELVRRYGPTALFLAVALGATFLGYREAVRYERSVADLDFQNTVERDLHVLEDVLDRQLHVAEAALALFRSSQSVEKAEFRIFAQSVLEGSELRAVEWIPYVSASKRAAFESALGRPFTEWSDNGVPAPAGPREAYYPIYFLEPPDGNEAALGFDLGSEPTRKKALAAARESGKLAIAGPLRTVQDPTGPLSYLVLLPHYRSLVSSVETRREAIVGFVVAVLQPQTVLEHTAGLTSGVTLSIADGDQLVAGHDPPKASAGRPDRPVLQRPLELGPRQLLVTASAGDRFLEERASSLPLVVLLGGTAVSVLTCLYLALLATTIARQRDTEESLRRAELRYRTAFEEAPEAIAIIDPRRVCFVDVNPAGEALLKMSRSEFLGRDPRDISPPFQPDGQPSYEKSMRFIQRALAGEKPHFEWEFRDSEGKPVECEVRLGLLPGEDGDLVRSSGVDISERRRAEERQRELLRELDHRVKNCFATVLALAEQTTRSAVALDDFRSAFSGRVRALARAHEALAARRWTGAPLRTIAEMILAPYQSAGSERVRMAGPPTTLRPQAASALAMILHELATNAAKYGALSVAAGHIEIDWTPNDEAFVLEWREHGGPSPSEARPSGFGTTLIQGLVEHELGGTVDVERRPDGPRYRIVISPEHVVVGTGDDEGRSTFEKDASRAAPEREVQG